MKKIHSDLKRDSDLQHCSRPDFRHSDSRKNSRTAELSLNRHHESSGDSADLAYNGKLTRYDSTGRIRHALSDDRKREARKQEKIERKAK